MNDLIDLVDFSAESGLTDIKKKEIKNETRYDETNH